MLGVKLFGLNQLDDRTIQIYGEISGFALKKDNGAYAFSFKFFDSKKRLVRIENYDDNTVRTKEQLRARILKTLESEEYNDN